MYKIKNIGYKYLGYKLGQKIKFNKQWENIVGFDEECNLILITYNTGFKFKVAKSDLTTGLDVADEQKVYWVDIKDIKCIKECKEVVFKKIKMR